MKLNRNFVQITTTALITSAAFIIPMANSGTFIFNMEPAPSTRFATWKEAVKMHSDYIGYRPMLVKVPEADNGTVKNLDGFLFEASQLDEIINRNHSGTNPDKVFFMFGQQDTFPNGFLHRARPNLRIIAVGMSGQTFLNTEKTAGTGISVFDKADPCPPNCPDIK